ncbi:C39 family peptidase [Lentzea nigeriaca]
MMIHVVVRNARTVAVEDRQVRAVPYRAQWESPDLIADILAGALPAADDPLWARSGADSAQEYEFWSWRACGMACLKMALAYWGLEEPPLVQLAEEASSHGAYERHETGVRGLIYAPFVSYVEQRFGLSARSCPDLPPDALAAEISAGGLVLASVHAGIRRPDTTPPHRGGHLVLVIGCTGTEVVFHNPSGDRTGNQAFATVSREEFERFYAGRGIVLGPGRPGPATNAQPSTRTESPLGR